MSTQEPNSVFRESFVWRFRESGRQTLRRFGELVFDMANDGDTWGPTGEPIVFGEVEAARVDLRGVIDYLDEASRDALPGEPETAVLAGAAAKWAERLREVEGEIHQALGPEVAPDRHARVRAALEGARQAEAALRPIADPSDVDDLGWDAAELAHRAGELVGLLESLLSSEPEDSP